MKRLTFLLTLVFFSEIFGMDNQVRFVGDDCSVRFAIQSNPEMKQMVEWYLQKIPVNHITSLLRGAELLVWKPDSSVLVGFYSNLILGKTYIKLAVGPQNSISLGEKDFASYEWSSTGELVVKDQAGKIVATVPCTSDCEPWFDYSEDSEIINSANVTPLNNVVRIDDSDNTKLKICSLATGVSITIYDATHLIEKETYLSAWTMPRSCPRPLLSPDGFKLAYSRSGLDDVLVFDLKKLIHTIYWFENKCGCAELLHHYQDYLAEKQKQQNMSSSSSYPCNLF